MPPKSDLRQTKLLGFYKCNLTQQILSYDETSWQNVLSLYSNENYFLCYIFVLFMGGLWEGAFSSLLNEVYISIL